MVSINILPDQHELVPEWKKEVGYTSPILLADSRAEVMNTYGFRGTPANFLLDEEGKIIYHVQGYKVEGEKVLEAEIRKLLGL